MALGFWDVSIGDVQRPGALWTTQVGPVPHGVAREASGGQAPA